MRRIALGVYDLLVALWVGGIAIFTFLVTPILFKSFGRDLAGEIVAKLFPVYFPFLLALSVATLVVLLVAVGSGSGWAARVSMVLIVAAIAVNAWHQFKTYPDSVEIRTRVTSFEKESPDSPARKAFSRLHAVSAVMNLFVLVDGLALLLLARGLRPKG